MCHPCLSGCTHFSPKMICTRHDSVHSKTQMLYNFEVVRTAGWFKTAAFSPGLGRDC